MEYQCTSKNIYYSQCLLTVGVTLQHHVALQNGKMGDTFHAVAFPLVFFAFWEGSCPACEPTGEKGRQNCSLEKWQGPQTGGVQQQHELSICNAHTVASPTVVKDGAAGRAAASAQPAVRRSLLSPSSSYPVSSAFAMVLSLAPRSEVTGLPQTFA